MTHGSNGNARASAEPSLAAAMLDADLVAVPDRRSQVLAELANVIGSMRALASKRNPPRSLHESLRLLEALGTALAAEAPSDDVVRVIASSADRINFATTGRQRGDTPKWKRSDAEEDGPEIGPSAVRMRDYFASWVAKPEAEASNDALAMLLCGLGQTRAGRRILPETETLAPTVRLTLFTDIVADLRVPNARARAGSIAEAIIVKAAKACGVSKPSRFFQADYKVRRPARRGPST